jgi:hypothetical protein
MLSKYSQELRLFVLCQICSFSGALIYSWEKSMLGYVFPTGETRGEKEREHTGANGQASPPPSPWSLFIGEVEMVVYILFH